MEILRKDSWNQQYAEEKVKKTLIDLLFYMVFLFVVSIISLGTIGHTTYYMSDMLTKLLVEKQFDLNQLSDPGAHTVDETTFLELTTVDEYWTYLQTHFIDTMYAAAATDKNDSNSNMFLQMENLLLGPPRLRQVRVRNGSCAVHPMFQLRFGNCYGSFRRADEDRGTFGVGSGSAWTHSTADRLGGVFHWGRLGAYPGGGYYQDLVAERVASEKILGELRAQRWIDVASRVVLVEFTIYNANLNLFCVAKLIAELPATGGVLTSASFPTVKLLRFVDPFDYFVLVCELLFLLQTAWFTCVEVLQLRRERWAYFRSFWNLIDMTIVAIAFTSLAFSLYRYVYLSGIDAGDNLVQLRATGHHDVRLDALAFWQVQYNMAMACCVFLVWMKVFKYLSFNRTLLQLSMTLSRCATDLLAFGLMFLIVFVAYAQLGYVLFGTENADFRTYGDSVLTLLRTVLGDFDYVAIERANRVLGPIFFVSYIFFVFFVLLNMFLAIINDTYAEVKAVQDAGTVQVGAYLRERVAKLWGWAKRVVLGRWKRQPEEMEQKNVEMAAVSEVASTEDVLREHNLTGETQEHHAVAEASTICVPINGVCLEDLFERVSDGGGVTNGADIMRRLELVERTIDHVVDKLNEFLVLYREHNQRTSNDESQL